MITICLKAKSKKLIKKSVDMYNEGKNLSQTQLILGFIPNSFYVIAND